MGASRIIRIFAGLLVIGICIVNVTGLQCWQCDTFEQNDGCWGEKANRTGSQCMEHEDVCIKIVTRYQVPHNGPRNRTAEKDRTRCDGHPQKKQVVEYMTKSCAEKKSFSHFTKTDRRCTEQTIGGGGTQERCMCSGNLCNAAVTQTATSAGHLLVSLTVLYTATKILN